MLSDLASLASLVGGTIALRPYVIAFLLAFLVVASRDLGIRATLGWLRPAGSVSALPAADLPPS